MSTMRSVATKFWSDNYIVDLDETEKLLFIYFLTNEHTNISGIYELPKRTMIFESGIDKENVDKAVDKFSADSRVFYFGGWVVLKNFLKHQKLSLNMKKGVINRLDLVPPDVWAKINKNKTLSNHYQTIRKTLPNSNSNSNSNSNKKGKENKKFFSPPLSLSQFVDKCKKSEKRHMQILGDYAEERGSDFKTVSQWHGFVKRNKDDATALEPYTEDQIGKAMIKLDKARKEYLTEWNLKTLIKFLDQS